MAYVKKLFNDNFLHYASYVIRDRAIPDLADGLKPVQRRILHSLFEMDDGKFHKVANVVGHCMKYHPHGDASIYSALVVLANKELFIDRQGNFGNLYTGDEASAARYIECRTNAFAKDVFHNPKITEYLESYDGRNREPEAFPAKLPVVLMTGAEGIAVGMSTKILPHNPVEVIEAEIAALKGKKFQLLPDFPTGGYVDAAEYQDGLGKVRVRAKFDFSDPKRLVIRELPFGATTESLIESIEAAAKSGRVKIASISDFTTENVEIELKLARGVYADEVVDALYAFTDCEQSISCNLLVIKDNFPVLMTVTEVVKHHAKTLLGILERELKIEEGELLDELHARTLERIFIEERVYKKIETMKTAETVRKAVLDGLKPFAKEIARAVTDEDVERLLKIPIRRISLYDIERAKDEMRKIEERLAEVRGHLAKLVDYAVLLLKGYAARLKDAWPRRTEETSFHRIDVKEVARRDIALRYDPASGYLGTAVSTGQTLFDVSPFDKVLVIRRNGLWSVSKCPEKLFVDKGLLHCAIADKDALADVVFSMVYRDAKGHAWLKRARIEAWILDKDYPFVPDEAKVLAFSAEPRFAFGLRYEKKPKVRVLEERFKASAYEPVGIKARGVKLADRDTVEAFAVDSGGLFDDNPEPDPREAAARAKARADAPAEAEPKRGSGRPPKAAPKATPKGASKASDGKPKPASAKPATGKAAAEGDAPKRGRGRPPKASGDEAPKARARAAIQPAATKKAAAGTKPAASKKAGGRKAADEAKPSGLLGRAEAKRGKK